MEKIFMAIHSVLKLNYGDCRVDYLFYGAIPPKHVDAKKHFLRSRFFAALEKDGIDTHIGYCQSFDGNLIEKGVDVLLALDLYQLSLQQYDLLLLFSADGDLVPAVKRAQQNGSKVVIILREGQPASLMKKAADGVIPLEAVIRLIDVPYIVRQSKVKERKKCVFGIN